MKDRRDERDLMDVVLAEHGDLIGGIALSPWKQAAMLAAGCLLPLRLSRQTFALRPAEFYSLGPRHIDRGPGGEHLIRDEVYADQMPDESL